MKILTPNQVLESARRRGFWREAAEGNRNSRGYGGMPHRDFFCFREGFRCLLVISKGTFQALKKTFFLNFFLDISLSSEWNDFSSEGEVCRQF